MPPEWLKHSTLSSPSMELLFTGLQTGLLQIPDHVDLEDVFWDVLDGLGLLTHMPSEGMGAPDMFQTIFLLLMLDCTVSDSLPSFEETCWGELPAPDQFEILSDEDTSDEFTRQKAREPMEEGMHTSEVPKSNEAETHEEGLPLQDYDLTTTSLDGRSVDRITLRLKGDSFTPLMWCTLEHLQGDFHLSSSPRAGVAIVIVIKDLIGSMENFREIFFAKLAKFLDKESTLMSIIYTTDPDRTIINSQWKREPVYQLRIRINGVLKPMKRWGTSKFNMHKMKALVDEEAKLRPQKAAAEGMNRTVNTLVIDSWDRVGKQLRAYFPDHMQHESEIAFLNHTRQGAFAPKSDGEAYTWATWLHDKACQTLRVNHVYSERTRGNALDMMAILIHSIHQAQTAADVVDMVVWDPPQEMYDAALALADDEEHGLRFSVFKEEAGPWRVFTRWHPVFEKGSVWKQREFFCFPGSIDCY